MRGAAIVAGPTASRGHARDSATGIVLTLGSEDGHTYVSARPQTRATKLRRNATGCDWAERGVLRTGDVDGQIWVVGQARGQRTNNGRSAKRLLMSLSSGRVVGCNPYMTRMP